MPAGRPRKPRDEAGNIIEAPPVGYASLRDPIDPPADMAPEAQDYWRAVVPGLVAAGVVTQMDLGAVRAMCACYGDMLRAQKQLDAEGLVVTWSSDRGETTREHPASKIVAARQGQLLRWQQHFGMTPASRSRLVVEGMAASRKGVPVADEMEGLLP